MFDSNQQPVNSQSTANNQQINNEFTVSQQLVDSKSVVDSGKSAAISSSRKDGLPIDRNAPGWTVGEMAKNLNMKRETLISRFTAKAVPAEAKKAYAYFKSQGVALGAASNAQIRYPEPVWTEILPFAGLEFPSNLRSVSEPESVESEVISAQPVERFSTGAMVIAPTTEVLSSNGYGLRFDLGQATEIHLHVHTTNAEIYKQQSLASAQSTQNMINALLQQQAEQGVRDREEIDETVQAIKNKMVEVRTANMAMGKPTGEQSPQSA